MAFNRTFYLGVAINGDTGNPGDINGLVFDRRTCSYINPSYSVWRQTGAPFGSAQTDFLADGSKDLTATGVSICQTPAGSAAGGACGFTVNQFGIQGIPEVEGVFTGSFGASGAYAGETYELTIVRPSLPGGGGMCPIITITPATLPTGFGGIAYSQTLSASGGTGPYTFDVISGALPSGLSLSSGGVLSGTPGATGTFGFSVRAIDTNGCTAVKHYSLIINAARRTQIRGYTQIKPQSVTEVELAASVAGNGLSGGAGSPLAVSTDSAGGLEIAADAVRVKLDGTSLSVGASGLKVTDSYSPNNIKNPVRVATTGNITLSGTQTIDGVAVIAGDRVLVKNQTTGSGNGIYVCASGAWSRSTDADNSAEVLAGMLTSVAEGNTNADTLWILKTDAPITLGTTALVFRQFLSMTWSVLTNGSQYVPELVFDSRGDTVMTALPA